MPTSPSSNPWSVCRRRQTVQPPRAWSSRGTLLAALIGACFALLVLPTSSIAATPTPAAGYEHTCALTKNGGVKCWGSNSHGQLGDGTMTGRSEPADVIGLTSGVRAVAAGGYHNCVVMDTGGVKCWGGNGSGQLGDGSLITRTMPADVVGLTSGVRAIAAGRFFTCALMDSGRVNCWGDNAAGQLGDGTTITRSEPRDAISLTSAVRAIAAGANHSCAVMDSGGVKCWGTNQWGQLGDGTVDWRITPADVSGLTSGVRAIAAGANHTCAVMDSGGVKCWGENYAGQLGDGTNGYSLFPVTVSGLTSPVIAIAAGDSHTCASTGDGTVRCWGNNHYGQLGDGTTTESHVAVKSVAVSGTLVNLAADANHTCGGTVSGRILCWGDNRYGETGAALKRAVPGPVPGLGSNVASVSAGWYYTCAVTAAGGVKCWGMNGWGQLGNGTPAGVPSPIQIADYGYPPARWQRTPGDVVGLTSGVSAVVTAWTHTFALTTDGGVKWWGYSANVPEYEAATFSNVAVDVTGLTSGQAAVADGCALSVAGDVSCWSWNFVDYVGWFETRVTAITGDFSHTGHVCALMVGGIVRCWGSNSSGQLGDGTLASSTVPTQVVGLTGATMIAAGREHTCAGTASGVVCWGANASGQLGDGTVTNRSTPVSVVGLTGPVVALAAGDSHTCAVTSSGEAKCWGANQYGQIGDGSFTTPRTTPQTVTGLLSGVTKITAGGFHSCAVVGGGVQCWGNNPEGGVLGDTPDVVPIPGFLPTTPSDFDADRRSDIVWQNRVTGETAFWLMNGTTMAGRVTVPAPMDPNWKIAAVVDFDQDDRPDLLLRNTLTGDNQIWYMNGTTIARTAAVRAAPDGNWQIVAAADFNFDAKPDIVWRNSVTGENVVWFMDGAEFQSYTHLPVVSDRNWQIVAADDFNADGRADLLWRNRSTGENSFWYANASGAFETVLWTAMPPDWAVAAAGDFDGDGTPSVLWRNTRTGELLAMALTGETQTTTLPVLTDAWGTFSAPGRRPPLKDFNGDGQVDMVWRNRVSGQVIIWLMNGTTVTSEVHLTGPTDPRWVLAGVADFNQDGKPDLLWRHPVTGENLIWYLDGTTVTGTGAVETVADTEWQIVAAADFNHDGKSDIVWRHAVTGQDVIWFMDGATRAAYTVLASVETREWQVLGGDDFNGDGTAEVLWRHRSTNEIGVWYFWDGGTLAQYVPLDPVDPGWRLAGTGDFDGDGDADLVWRNPMTGEMAAWRMDDTTHVGTSALPAVTDPDWEALPASSLRGPGPGDFNLDGTTDIVWRNTETRANRVWYMNGASAVASRTLTEELDPTWRIVGSGDFNGDFKPDLAWRNLGTGENRIWLMNGSAMTASLPVTTVADLTSKIVAIADFNGGGKADLVWRNGTTGENTIWLMDGANDTAAMACPTVSDLTWEIVGAGDFNADGKPDLVWRNGVTGENVIWFMDGPTMTGYTRIRNVDDMNWRIVAVGDYDGDGEAELLWRNTADGGNIIWHLRNAAFVSYEWLPLSTPAWTTGPGQ